MDDEAADVARQVIDYIERHPLSADTWEGIARWWLPRGLWIKRQTIQEALDYLVAIRFLRARRLPSGEALYSAALDHEEMDES